MFTFMKCLILRLYLRETDVKKAIMKTKVIIVKLFAIHTSLQSTKLKKNQ